MSVEEPWRIPQGWQGLGRRCCQPGSRPSGWTSAALALKRSHGKELWQGLSHNSLGDLGLSGFPFLHLSSHTGHSRPVPVACLAGGLWCWPLLPQPLGKLQRCSSTKEIPSLGECSLCTAQLHPSTLKTFQATYPNSSPVLTPLPRASALACLQPLCCWPQRGSSRTTRECQQLRVLSNPGWMFSTYSLIFLSADYCLTFLERQLEAPANFYDILKLHICLIYLLLPSPGLHPSLAIHLFMLHAQNMSYLQRHCQNIWQFPTPTWQIH